MLQQLGSPGFSTLSSPAKVLYGLDTTWLLKGDLKRLDAAQAQWLRQILHIPFAYYSRITDETVE